MLLVTVPPLHFLVLLLLTMIFISRPPRIQIMSVLRLSLGALVVFTCLLAHAQSWGTSDLPVPSAGIQERDGDCSECISSGCECNSWVQHCTISELHAGIGSIGVATPVSCSTSFFKSYSFYILCGLGAILIFWGCCKAKEKTTTVYITRENGKNQYSSMGN